MKVIDLDVLPSDPLEALAFLSQAGSELEALLRQQVAAARKQGASWEEIGKRLGMSRQAAWEYYNRDVRQILDEAAKGGGLSEDEALRLAVDEVSEVRRHRRRASS